MCYYEAPVIQWMTCRHVQSVGAVRRFCHFQRPGSRAALPNACTTPVYFQRLIPFQALCPSCNWANYHRRVEQAIALYGPEVVPLVQRPPYLIPLHSVCAWPGPSGIIGLAPSPVELTCEEHGARVAEWVLFQTQYQYEAVQRSTLYAMEGASIERLPTGWMERTCTRLTVSPMLPAVQDVGNARIEVGREGPARRAFRSEGWRG